MISFFGSLLVLSIYQYTKSISNNIDASAIYCGKPTMVRENSVKFNFYRIMCLWERWNIDIGVGVIVFIEINKIPLLTEIAYDTCIK